MLCRKNYSMGATRLRAHGKAANELKNSSHILQYTEAELPRLVLRHLAPPRCQHRGGVLLDQAGAVSPLKAQAHRLTAEARDRVSGRHACTSERYGLPLKLRDSRGETLGPFGHFLRLLSALAHAACLRTEQSELTAQPGTTRQSQQASTWKRTVPLTSEDLCVTVSARQRQRGARGALHVAPTDQKGCSEESPRTDGGGGGLCAT